MFLNGDILIMSRLIDAELIEKEEGWLDGTCLVIPKQIIYDAPTVDAEPLRHRHWITYDKEYDKCSICGNLHHYSESYGYYCQHCGGKMDG